MYLSIYHNLCESKKQAKESYAPGSGLHKHHIIPTHMGGSDEEDNYTYLTVREHIIAHYLLWKIYKNPNDLRSMKMLGAKLTPAQRKITGEFCRDNGIGFHNPKYDGEVRTSWCLKGMETQKEMNSKQTFYYWKTPEGRKERASLGGKVGGKTQKENQQGIHDPANFGKYSSIGGKALKGMICVTNGKHRTRIRPEKLEEYLQMGYRRGFTLS